MKATGIVRRIEECGIIGQKAKNPKALSFSLAFVGLNLHKSRLKSLF